jgi:hypothetical protein
MADAKPLASLTSGLLARKGGAKPAMRRQVSLSGGSDLGQMASHMAGHDDLGWNDMGYDVNPDQSQANHSSDNRPMLSPMPSPVQSAAAAATASAAAPVVALYSKDSSEKSSETASPSLPEVVRQQAALQDHVRTVDQPALIASVAPTRARTPRRQAGAKGTFAFTLRLDPDRHMKLRLASALKNVSAQNMLTQAVDQLLAAIPGLDAVAEQARNTTAKDLKS